MQPWFFLALLAPAIWSIGNIIDVYLVKKLIPDTDNNPHSLGSLILVSCLVGVLFLPIIAIFHPPVFLVSTTQALLLGVVGVIEGLAILCYLYGLQSSDDTSSIIAWFNSIPIINLVLGFLFLGEIITQKQFLGFGFTLLGLILVSIQISEIGIILKKRVALFMLLSSVGYGLMTTLFKVGAIDTSFWVASFWQYVGLTILGIVLFIFIKPYQKAFLTLFKNRGFSFYGINLINELLFVAGTMIANFAALLGPIAMVSLVGSFQPIFVLFFGFFISQILPQVFKNELAISKKDLLLKITGIIFTLIGIWFI